ncbi:MAG: His/Gly/Thr/Pro-type tRNA ligase C-terminal domain-containing protein [Patescibacteria group bacterium]
MIPAQKAKKQIETSPEFEKAACIAGHYGFIALPAVEVEKADITAAKKFDESKLAALHPWTDNKERFSGYLEEKIAIIRNFGEKKWVSLGMPLLAYYEGPMKGNPHLRRAAETRTFHLEIIGGAKPIAEAMAIETAYIILKDRYPDEELMIEINSIGDKDSMARFARELGNYVRKEIGKLPASLKQAIKKDPFSLFTIEDEKCKEFVDAAPKPMNFLSEPSRTHFSEVLDYLESLKLPYEINPKLLGNRSYCTDTIFEIRGKKDVLAIGERYNGVAKKIWGKKDMPALGIAILMHPHFVMKNAVSKSKMPKEVKPKFYFIQFGDTAKKRCLNIIEDMRKAAIPVHQSLSKDKLSIQLASAENMKIPYIIMMGQKEAMEECVVVRNMTTRVQETVELHMLVPHLRRLK